MIRQGTSPVVSVVMPTYNRADILPETIGTILNQDFEDLELVVVDDGSADETQRVLRALRGKDSRLRAITLAGNRGIGFARHTGIAAGAGRYIAQADSDDHWLPGKLSRQVTLMEKYPQVDILFANYLNIDKTGFRKTIEGFALTREGFEVLETSALEDGVQLVAAGIETGLLRSDFVSPSTTVLRRSVFEKVGGYSVVLRSAQDHEFFWRAAVKGARFAYLEQVVLHRYLLPSSDTTDFPRAATYLLEAMQICRQTCKDTHREDLLHIIEDAEYRHARNVISYHGRRGHRQDCLLALFRSWRYGFSVRDVLRACALLVRPQIVDECADRHAVRQQHEQTGAPN